MPHPSLRTTHLIPGPPKHRHASPSGPWPFMDIDAEVDTQRLADQEEHFLEVAKECTHNQFTHLMPNDTGLGDEWDDLDSGGVGSGGAGGTMGSGDNWDRDRYTSIGGWVGTSGSPSGGGGGNHERTGSTGSVSSMTSGSPGRRPTRRATVFQYKPANSKFAAMTIPMVTNDPMSYSSSPSPTFGEGASGSGSSSPVPNASGNASTPTSTNANANPGFANAIASGRPGSPTSITSVGSTGSLGIPSPTVSEYHAHHYPPGFNTFHKAQEQQQNEAQNTRASSPPRGGSIELLSESSSTEFGLNVESATPYRSMSLDTMMSRDAEYEETVPCWCKYPKSLYPNWTETQQKTSGILDVRRIEPQVEEGGAGVWILDVVKKEKGGRVRGHVRTGSAGSDKGKERERDAFRASSSLSVPDSPTTPTMLSASPFVSVSVNTPSNAFADPDEFQEVSFVNKDRVMRVYEKTLDDAWERFLTPRPENVKTRVLFVDKLTGPIMQMIGTHFQIEPFFFSSTIGRIPSRFQSNVVPEKSDHLTITLPFIRSVKCSDEEIQGYYKADGRDNHLIIDTEQPLPLSESNNLLLSDMLSLHIIRSPRTNTIISIHPPSSQKHTVSAETLYTRVFATGRSVYWNHILKASRDPTFLFLSFLWYALYAWDEAFEHLYSHICALESKIMNVNTMNDMNDMRLTQELHVVRAHLLHYESMLDDFRKTVVFVLSSPNQALVGMGVEEQEEIRRDLEEQEYVVNVGFQKDDSVVEEVVNPWLMGDNISSATSATTTTMTTTMGIGVGVISEEPEEEEEEDAVSPQKQRHQRASPSTPTKLSGMRLRAQSASSASKPLGLATALQAPRPPLVGVSPGSHGASFRPRASSHSQQAPPPSPSAIHNLRQGTSGTATSPPNSPNKYPTSSSSTSHVSNTLSGRPGSPTMTMQSPTRGFSITSNTTASATAHPLRSGTRQSSTRQSSTSSLVNTDVLRQRYEVEAQHRKVSRAMMRKECAKLLQEIERLEKARSTQNKRLKNVMDLGFSIVNIEDSKKMHELTKAALRDSAAMKQISYLTMVFLPSSFVAAAFGMNVIEINPGGAYAHLWQYVAFSIPLTLVTVWVIIALQIEMHQTPSKKSSSSPSKASGKGTKSKSRSKRVMEDAHLPGTTHGAAPSINVNGAPTYDTDLDSSTTDSASSNEDTDTEDEGEDEDGDDMPVYGEFYASSLDHKPGLLSKFRFTRRGTRDSGDSGRIPTSNDPAPPAERMTPHPILGQRPGAGGGGSGYGARSGADGRGMIELSLWRRLAWPVWMFSTFFKRQRLRWKRAKSRREKRAKREKRRAEREERAKAKEESRAQSIAA